MGKGSDGGMDLVKCLVSLPHQICRNSMLIKPLKWEAVTLTWPKSLQLLDWLHQND